MREWERTSPPLFHHEIIRLFYQMQFVSGGRRTTFLDPIEVFFCTRVQGNCNELGAFIRVFFLNQSLKLRQGILGRFEKDQRLIAGIQFPPSTSNGTRFWERDWHRLPGGL